MYGAQRTGHLVACGNWGKENQSITTMEKNNGKLDPKQREHLAQMLKDAKTSEQGRLREADDVSAIFRDLAGKSGALELVTKVEELENKKEAAVKELAALGFEFSYSNN